MARLSVDGFWPREMDDAARAASLAEFERAVFPIAAGVERRAKEHDVKLTMEQVNAPGQVLFECATMHEQEMEIRRSGVRARRISSDQDRMGAIRRRAARNGGFSTLQLILGVVTTWLAIAVYSSKFWTFR